MEALRRSRSLSFLLASLLASSLYSSSFLSSSLFLNSSLLLSSISHLSSLPLFPTLFSSPLLSFPAVSLSLLFLNFSLLLSLLPPPPLRCPFRTLVINMESHFRTTGIALASLSSLFSPLPYDDFNSSITVLAYFSFFFFIHLTLGDPLEYIEKVWRKGDG